MSIINRPILFSVVVFSAIAAAPTVAWAGLLISSETVIAAPGSTGFVQLLLSNNFATPQSLSAFSVEITLAGSGVRFTGLDDQTTPPYVFNGFGTGILTFDVFPNAGFIESDVSLNSDGFFTLAVGQTVGLGRLAFEADIVATGGLRPISFVSGSTTQFLNAVGAPYVDSDVAFIAGGINVQSGTGAVPEPASVMIWSMAGFVMALTRLQRRRVGARFIGPILGKG